MRKYFDITSWLLLFLFAPFTVLILLSQNSIPGDVFYPVKRGLENMILVAASVSPTTRVAFRTDLTERRFSEAQQLLTARADTTAFTDFINEVSTTQQDVSNLSNSQDKIKTADALIAKIDQYQSQLSQVQNQVQIAQAQSQTGQPSATTAVPVPGNTGVVEKKACVQVIAYARNPDNGTCQSFSTPCDVPDGWQSCSPSQSAAPSPTQAPSTDRPIQTQTPALPPTAQPFVPASPAPSLAPIVSNEIANNLTKREEVKNTISNTKEELEKIKEKLQKDREEGQTKQKIQEEQQKLKQNIEEGKKSGENK